MTNDVLLALFKRKLDNSNTSCKILRRIYNLSSRTTWHSRLQFYVLLSIKYCFSLSRNTLRSFQAFLRHRFYTSNHSGFMFCPNGE